MNKSFNRGFIVFLILMTAIIAPVFAEAQNNTQIASSQSEIKATVPFFLMRHGETEYNANHISQGTLDIPLDEVGRAEALNAAKELKGKGVKKIYSSNLSRAKETAEIVRSELQIKEPIIIVPDLKERYMGEAQGKPAEGKSNKLDFDATPPGSESIAVFRKRVVDAFISIINKNEEGVLIVSHGGSIREFFEFINFTSGNIKNAVPVKLIPPSKEWKVEPIAD